MLTTDKEKYLKVSYDKGIDSKHFLYTVINHLVYMLLSDLHFHSKLLQYWSFRALHRVEILWNWETVGYLELFIFSVVGE